MKERKEQGITLIALVITIIILLILAGITISQLTGKGLLNKAEKASTEEQKKQATEIMNLKITECQMKSYTEKQEMPTLSYLSDYLKKDDDIEYVEEESQRTADTEGTTVTLDSIYTKLKKYPYKFEIDSELKLASIDNVKVATGTTSRIDELEKEVSDLKAVIGNLSEYAKKTDIQNSSSIKFIDSSKSLSTICNETTSWLTSADYSYEATEDCIISGWVASYITGSSPSPSDSSGINIMVNNISIMRAYTSNTSYSVQFPINFYLSKGDTVRIKLEKGSFKGHVVAYAIK